MLKRGKAASRSWIPSQNRHGINNIQVKFLLNSVKFYKKTNGNEKNNGLNVMNYDQDCVKKLKMYFVHKSPYLEFLIKLDLKKIIIVFPIMRSGGIAYASVIKNPLAKDYTYNNK